MNFHKKQMKLYEVEANNFSNKILFFKFNIETRRIDRERKLREHQQRKIEKEASRTFIHKRDSLT